MLIFNFWIGKSYHKIWEPFVTLIPSDGCTIMKKPVLTNWKDPSGAMLFWKLQIMEILSLMAFEVPTSWIFHIQHKQVADQEQNLEDPHHQDWLLWKSTDKEITVMILPSVHKWLFSLPTHQSLTYYMPPLFYVCNILSATLLLCIYAHISQLHNKWNTNHYYYNYKTLLL